MKINLDHENKRRGPMRARCFIVIGLIAAMSIFSGCAGTTMLDKNWGKSLESARSDQILNPEAGQNLDPVVGLDGQAAERTLGTYRQGFEAKKGKKVYNLNLGNIDSIGKK
jgi:hypothetical protein